MIDHFVKIDREKKSNHGFPEGWLKCICRLLYLIICLIV
jgi:hypothetical protein